MKKRKTSSSQGSPIWAKRMHNSLKPLLETLPNHLRNAEITDEKAINEIAIFLSKQVEVLESAEKIIGPTPVRHKGIMSRAEISELAVGLLGYHLHKRKIRLEPAIETIAQLLKVNTYKLSQSHKPDEKRKAIELFISSPELSNREIARRIDIPHQTIGHWRKEWLSS